MKLLIRRNRKIHLVGSGIASLAAAAYLIRDSGIRGEDIFVYEEASQPGGALDAQRCIEAHQILPHDPDGYLRDFQRAVSSPDPVIREYLTEALQCFLRDLHRASAIMRHSLLPMNALIAWDASGLVPNRRGVN